MFSLTPSELLTIGIVALIVFGPRRLPELARRAGQMVAYLKSAAAEVRGEVQGELDTIADPFREAAADLKTQGETVSKAATAEIEEAVRPFREAATDLAADGKTLAETADGELKWIEEESP